MKLLSFLLVFGLIAGSVHADDKATVVKGNTEFALNLYAKLSKNEGNLFLSPYSISTALGMTSGGARENTLKEMLATLHLPEGESAHAGFAALQAELNGGDPKTRGFELSVANALWGQKNYPWKAPFLELTKKHYGAGLFPVDFVGETEAARKTINTWVEKETKDKIKELLKDGVLSTDTRMVLTNAIYFKGTWVYQFDKKMTRDGKFQLAGGKNVEVPLMHQKGEFNFLENKDLQILEMPYAGKALSMVVFLPRKADGLAEMEKTLTATNVSEWIGKLRKTKEIDVTLPRFKMEAEFSLGEQLKALGMKDAFSASSADFSGLNGQKSDLFISAVVHKAFVDVNEEGTEAAAATAVVVNTRSARVTPTFRADHPFVFAIRDVRNGSLLFVGRVANPK